MQMGGSQEQTGDLQRKSLMTPSGQVWYNQDWSSMSKPTEYSVYYICYSMCRTVNHII